VLALSEPEVPVIVTVAAPTVAVELAVRVSTLVEVAGLVPKAAVTPVGNPDATRVTLPANGLTSVTVIVSVPLAPCAIDKVAAERLRLKLPCDAAVTVNAMVVEATGSDPDVPVIVTVALPAGAAELAVSVSTLLPVVGFVPNEAVTPLGNPVAASVTLPVNPPASATEIVAVPLPPWAIDNADAEDEIVKLGVAVAPSGN